MILLYHNLVTDSAPTGYRHTSLTLQASVFERHVRWLSTRFHIVSLEEYLEHSKDNDSGKRKKIVITFDDGTATSFACAFPVLQRLRVPATFFVTTCHLEHGDLMPGCYLNAVFFEEIYSDIRLDGQRFLLQTPSDRKRSRQLVGEMARKSGDQLLFTKEMARDYPLPMEIRALYQGMSYDQLQTAARSELVEIGAHTLTHPDLSALPIDKQKQEIMESKRTLADITGKPVRYFAYPSGEYTRETIDLVKNSGYAAAFAVIPRGLGDDPFFEVERVGVYSTSLFKLLLKTMGVAELMRRVGVRIG